MESSDQSLPSTSFTTIRKVKDNDCFSRRNLSRAFAIFLLCFINALNYINRYSLPPVIARLKVAFSLSDTQLGVIQSCFELVYVVCSPLFGYLGDRFNRRYLLAVSLVLSNASNLASSFVPEQNYIALLVTRALLGMGEAAYTNIGPVIIADMFVGKMRTFVFSAFQFAIPIGMSVGFLATSAIVDYFGGDWRWAFRYTPVPMAVCLVLLFVFVREPRRGQAENADDVRSNNNHEINANSKSESYSLVSDFAYLLKIPSFTLSTLAFVGVAFTTGALCYWAPYLISRIYQINSYSYSYSYSAPDVDDADAQVGFTFGLVAVVSGMVGVPVGALASGWMRPRCGPSADGIVSGLAMIAVGPCVYVIVTAAQADMRIAIWTSAFLATALLCSCFVLISEITMNVVIPTRRATAAAFMSSVSHLLGDALSPYLIGMISDQLRTIATLNDKPGSVNLFAEFLSIQRSMFIVPFIITIAGGLFLAASLFLNGDTKEATNLSHSSCHNHSHNNHNHNHNQIISHNNSHQEEQQNQNQNQNEDDMKMLMMMSQQQQQQTNQQTTSLNILVDDEDHYLDSGMML